MKTRHKMLLLAAAALAAVVLSIGAGSVFVPPGDILAILGNRLFGLPLPEGLPANYSSLILDLRLPRALLAFLTGGTLAVCGTAMQSVLQNPLASPFGLGVSSGAGLGAALVMVLGLSGVFLPAVSLCFAMGTIFLVLLVAARLDRNLSNITVVLVGMVLALFCSAVLNLLATTSPQNAQRLQLWQLGSFSMRGWTAVLVVCGLLAVGLPLFLKFARELDVMSFGEEQARAMGVDLLKTKGLLMALIALLTGGAVAFAGVIGFVDLIAPHVVRRWFGAAHRRTLPASALFGGAFLVLCDLAARTLAPPREIPIGAITALLGAPFFLYIFFRTRKKGARKC